jgi:hypothetical protein
MASLSPAEIDWYVASGESRDKAGAYAIQGLASRYVTGIQGSYSNVVGLPVAVVYRWLRDLPVIHSSSDVVSGDYVAQSHHDWKGLEDRRHHHRAAGRVRPPVVTLRDGTEYYKHVEEVTAQPNDWYDKRLQLTATSSRTRSCAARHPDIAFRCRVGPGRDGQLQRHRARHVQDDAEVVLRGRCAAGVCRG